MKKMFIVMLHIMILCTAHLILGTHKEDETIEKSKTNRHVKAIVECWEQLYNKIPKEWHENARVQAIRESASSLAWLHTLYDYRNSEMYNVINIRGSWHKVKDVTIECLNLSIMKQGLADGTKRQDLKLLDKDTKDTEIKEKLDDEIRKALCSITINILALKQKQELKSLDLNWYFNTIVKAGASLIMEHQPDQPQTKDLPSDNFLDLTKKISELSIKK